jgi:flagellar hook assembly protein FlgD
LKGRLVKKLVDQTLQASEGDLIWDGRDKNGKNLPVGVYILLMEATSRESEKTYRKTTTVVIGK